MAAKRVTHVRDILEKIGLDPDRVEIFYNSSAMGPQFVQTCIDFTQKIKDLGPALPSKALLSAA